MKTGIVPRDLKMLVLRLSPGSAKPETRVSVVWFLLPSGLSWGRSEPWRGSRMYSQMGLSAQLSDDPALSCASRRHGESYTVCWLVTFPEKLRRWWRVCPGDHSGGPSPLPCRRPPAEANCPLLGLRPGPPEALPTAWWPVPPVGNRASVIGRSGRLF